MTEFVNPWLEKVPLGGGNAGHNPPGEDHSTKASIYIPSVFRGGSGGMSGESVIYAGGLKCNRFELPESMGYKGSKNKENIKYEIIKWDGLFSNMSSSTSTPTFMATKYNYGLEKAGA